MGETQALFHTETYLKTQRKNLRAAFTTVPWTGITQWLKKSIFNWKRFNRVSAKQMELNFKQHFQQLGQQTPVFEAQNLSTSAIHAFYLNAQILRRHGFS